MHGNEFSIQYEARKLLVLKRYFHLFYVFIRVSGRKCNLKVLYFFFFFVRCLNRRLNSGTIFIFLGGRVFALLNSEPFIKQNLGRFFQIISTSIRRRALI